jgi:hypothetical protein
VLIFPAETLRRTAQVLRAGRGLQPPAGGRVDRYALPAVLVAGWLAAALTHLRLPYPSDQLHYLSAAASFPEPIEGSGLIHQMTRFGLTAPIRLAMAVFGYSEAAYYFVPLLGGVLLLLGTYAIGVLMFSRVIGVAAAVVLLTYTPLFFDGTELMPDLFATGLFTCAVALAVAVRLGRLPGSAWPLSLIGFLLGWSYLVREFIVFVWPLVLVLLWDRLRAADDRPMWRGLLWPALPIVALVAAETVLCWAVYGDPLTRMRAVTGHGADLPSAVAATFQDKPRLEYMGRLWATLNGDENTYYPEHWVLRPLLLAALAGALVRPRRLGVFGLWILLMWVPLTLLGGVLDPSAPKLRIQLIRYWFPLFPALVLGGLVALWLLGSHIGGRAAARDRDAARVPAARVPAGLVPAAVVAVVASASLVLAAGNWGLDPTVTRGASDMRALRGWLGEHAGGVRAIWTDGSTRHVLQVYREGPFGGQAWRPRLLRLPAGGPGPVAGDVVVLFDAQGAQEAICGLCRRSAARTLGTPVRPAPAWREVYATRDGVVRAYRVGP